MLQKLREMRDTAKVSNKDIADGTGIPESTINKIFTGVTKEPTLSKISLIVHYLGYTLDDLSESSKPFISKDDNNLLKRYHTLDIYGKKAVDDLLNTEYERCKNKVQVIPIELPMSLYGASAGTGNWLDEEYNIRVKVKDTPEARRANIVIRVSGNSMEPKYSDDDKVLVKIQPDIDIGEIGVFIVDNQGYIKKKGTNELISLNPEYDNIPIGEFTNCICVGRVLGKAEIVEE